MKKSWDRPVCVTCVVCECVGVASGARGEFGGACGEVCLHAGKL